MYESFVTLVFNPMTVLILWVVMIGYKSCSNDDGGLKKVNPSYYQEDDHEDWEGPTPR